MTRSATSGLTAFLATLLAAAPADAQKTAGIGYGDVLAALNNIRSEMRQLEGLRELKLRDLTVVDIERALEEGDRNALADAISDRADNVERLRDAIDLSHLDVVDMPGTDKKRSLERTLAGLGVSVREIVAVKVSGDGLLIYYWDHETIPTVLDEMEAGIQDDEETGIEVEDLDA